MTFVFKHPKYYKELRSRNKLAESRQPVVGGQQKLDQAISLRKLETSTGERSPGPGHKQQAASDKQQASSDKLQAPSDSNNKRQASSPKQQASSFKPQAASSKILEPR